MKNTKNTKTILTYMSLLLNITATKSQNDNLTSVKIQLLLS